MKRILFLSPFFYPEMISTGKYNSYLVKAIIKRGYEVDVIASHPLYPNWEPKSSREQMEGCSIHRGGLWMHYPKSAVLRRIFLELWFVWHTAIETVKIRKNVDTVIAVFPPNLYVFLVNLALSSNVRKFGIVHDLQGIMAKTHKTLFRRMVAGIMKQFEILGLNSCEELICMSEKMRDAIVDKYGISQSKCSVHYPFITEDNQLEITSELADVMPEGCTHVVYSGALGEKQKPEFLLTFFGKLCDTRDNVMCHIFSRGPIFDDIKNRLKGKNTNKIKVHDLVPEKLLGELYERSSVQVIPQAEGTGAGAFPSKLPNLLKAGVPVFAICDRESELSKVISEAEAGTSMNEWDEGKCTESMMQFIDSISSQSHDDRYKKVRAYVNTNFNVDNIVDDIVGEDNKTKS